MVNKDNEMYILETLKQMKIQISNSEDKLMEEELVLNPILFQNKKAFIGNYDFFQSNQLKKILEDFGMSVEIFKTGSEILEKIKTDYKCDVIFTNNTYKKGIQGQELLEMLRKIEGFRVPIVVHTIEKNKKHFFEDIVGFDAYIEKPIFANNNEKILEVKIILEKILNQKYN